MSSFLGSFCSAQNDASFRKEKIQSLKLRGEKQLGAVSKQSQSSNRHSVTNLASPSQNGQLSEQTTRIDRLLKEIDALRETNKNLTEQFQVRSFLFFEIFTRFVDEKDKNYEKEGI